MTDRKEKSVQALKMSWVVTGETIFGNLRFDISPIDSVCNSLGNYKGPTNIVMNYCVLSLLCRTSNLCVCRACRSCRGSESCGLRHSVCSRRRRPAGDSAVAAHHKPYNHHNRNALAPSHWRVLLDKNPDHAVSKFTCKKYGGHIIASSNEKIENILRLSHLSIQSVKLLRVKIISRLKLRSNLFIQ